MVGNLTWGGKEVCGDGRMQNLKRVRNCQYSLELGRALIIVANIFHISGNSALGKEENGAF